MKKITNKLTAVSCVKPNWVYRKTPIILISPGADICSKGLFVIFFETVYGIFDEGSYFRGGGAYYQNITVFSTFTLGMPLNIYCLPIQCQ